MSISRKAQAPAAPTFTVIERTNRYEIHDGWVWQVCRVRLADGTVTYYDLPQHPRGGAL